MIKKSTCHQYKSFIWNWPLFFCECIHNYKNEFIKCILKLAYAVTFVLTEKKFT